VVMRKVSEESKFLNLDVLVFASGRAKSEDLDSNTTRSTHPI